MRLVGLLLHSVIFVRKAGTFKGIDILKYVTIIYPIGIEANTTDVGVVCSICYLFPYEPRCEKTGLRGFRPGPTLINLYSHRRWLEA